MHIYGLDSESTSESLICFNELGSCGEPVNFSSELQTQKVKGALLGTKEPRAAVTSRTAAWKKKNTKRIVDQLQDGMHGVYQTKKIQPQLKNNMNLKNNTHFLPCRCCDKK